MSFSFDPISATGSVRPVAATSSTPRTTPTAATDSAAAVTVDTMPSAPPAEVLDAIGTASRVAERMAASGPRLQFSVDAPTGRVSVQMTDHTGAVLRSLTGAQALAVAAGEPLA